jgi:GNAT superfamily N-acetyltransferase
MSDVPALDLIPRIVIKAVRDCLPEDRDIFHAHLLKSPEVEPDGLPERIARADSLAFVYLGTLVVAIGAIKRPGENYRHRKFIAAKTTEQGADYPIEMGWIYVEKEFRGRGLAGVVVQSLLPFTASHCCYATSDATNHRMHSSLTKRGFRQTGQPFPSERDRRPLLLFVRPSESVIA